jgi:hypothetical protein
MTTFYRLKFDSPSTWRARFPYLHPQGQGGPVITPCTGFPFPRLLRLAGIWWRPVGNEQMSLIFIPVCQIDASSYSSIVQYGDGVKLCGHPSDSNLSPCCLTWCPFVKLLSFLFQRAVLCVFLGFSRCVCMLECFNKPALGFHAFLSANPSSVSVLSGSNFIVIASLTRRHLVSPNSIQ